MQDTAGEAEEEAGAADVVDVVDVEAAAEEADAVDPVDAAGVVDKAAPNAVTVTTLQSTGPGSHIGSCSIGSRTAHPRF